MSETKPSMPAQPKTVELEQPPAWAISLMEKVTQGFTAVEDRLDTIETNQSLQGDTVRDLAKRVTAQEERLTKMEDRQNNTSIRVKEPSQHDIEIRAELVAERAAREALDKKVDLQGEKLATIETKTDAQTKMLETISTSVVDGVKSFWKRHPKLETALVGLLLAAAGVAYASLTHGGHLP